MFTYSSVKDLSYVDADNLAIKMTVKFDHLETEVPFIARGDDVEPHGVELYQSAVNGKFGPIVQYVTPVAPMLAIEQKQVQLKIGINTALDVKAKELQFVSFAEALTYVDEPAVPLYQKQALALRKWRSLCWAYYDEIVAAAKDFEVVATIEALPAFVL